MSDQEALATLLVMKKIKVYVAEWGLGVVAGVACLLLIDIFRELVGRKAAMTIAFTIGTFCLGLLWLLRRR